MKTIEPPIIWYDVARRYSVEYSTTGKIPKQNNILIRSYSLACCPVLCSPCIVWSFLARFILFPYQICCNGPQASCSNNSCSFIPDLCIQSCINETLRDMDLPLLHGHDNLENTRMSREEFTGLKNLVDALLEIFKEDLHIYQKCHYDITHNVVTPLIVQTFADISWTIPMTPSNSRENLKRFKVYVESIEKS